MPVCEMCHTPDGDPEVIFLHARCHMSAPSRVRIEGSVGKEQYLVVACYLPDCKREIARFRIVEEGVIAEVVQA